MENKKGGDALSLGTIIRVDNKVGGVLGVWSNFQEAFGQEWSKIHSDQNHTIYMLKEKKLKE